MQLHEIRSVTKIYTYKTCNIDLDIVNLLIEKSL